MAQPIQPFAGGGGYGNIMPPGYLEMAGREAERITQERNQRNDSAINAVGGLLGRGMGMDAGEVNAMFPSAMSSYYAQSSELDKKSNAMKKMLELNPEMFGLDKDQVKQMGDVTSKMSSTERSAFFQTYVPDLFKAQQAKLEQNALSQRASIGKEIAPDISNLGQGLKSVTSNQLTPARAQSLTPSSMPGSEINLQSGADRLQSHMESKYGADWRSRGLKVSRQDVIDAGL